ncbi:MAG TPA: thioredoxin domain-containing protein [Pyrinomonadaceae bacterium]|nr:thioredoxin domain-containing protein [Pyrinomonadaceae bacterium]
MKGPAICLLILCLFAAISGQRDDEILATAEGSTFTASMLPDDVRRAFIERNAAVADERTRLLGEMVRELLIDAEARTANSSAQAVVDAEMRKIPPPTEAEIGRIYEANRQVFGGRTLAQVRAQIVYFLRGNAEQESLKELTDRLKAKHKFVAGKDPNAVGIKDTEVLFSIAGKPVTLAEFNAKHRALLYDAVASIYVHAAEHLDEVILSAIINKEARARNISPSELIAVEVTDKLRDYTDEERIRLESALKAKLYEKYAVKILLKQPEPVAHNISADDDPFVGRPDAPVTVIMFSDFQCSACAATHPLLKRTLAEFGDKVRFVVKDFPLEGTHENALRAALAANAASAQGKFFEFVEILYQNQGSLDETSLKAFASEVGLNIKQFEIDFTNETAAAEIRKDIADGTRLGVRSTPSIFVNGFRLHRLSADGIRAAVDHALKSRPAK